jgi:hypothetical protein
MKSAAVGGRINSAVSTVHSGTLAQTPTDRKSGIKVTLKNGKAGDRCHIHAGFSRASFLHRPARLLPLQ